MKLILIFCVILFVIIIYSVIENRFIKTVSYAVQKSKDGSMRQGSEAAEQYKRIRIVQLSDLHGCRYGKHNQKLLDRIIGSKPDIVLLTGDIITKYRPVPEDVLVFLEKLSGLCPCIYSFGNHELKEREKYPNRFSEYIDKLSQCGIIILDNDTRMLAVRSVCCRIGAYSSDVLQYSRRRPDRIIAEIPVTVTVQNGIDILLSHDPELTEYYKATGYSLIFSGHYHGGIVRIPCGRGIISPRFMLFPRYDGGCYSLDNQHIMIVSRGLGSHTIRFRLFNRPELVYTDVSIEDN